MSSIPILSTLVLLLLFSGPAEAMFIQPEIERVPIGRLTTNLEKQVLEKPNDAELHYSLARVQSLTSLERDAPAWKLAAFGPTLSRQAHKQLNTEQHFDALSGKFCHRTILLPFSRAAMDVEEYRHPLIRSVPG